MSYSKKILIAALIILIAFLANMGESPLPIREGDRVWINLGETYSCSIPDPIVQTDECFFGTNGQGDRWYTLGRVKSISWVDGAPQITVSFSFEEGGEQFEHSRIQGNFKDALYEVSNQQAQKEAPYFLLLNW